MTNVVITKTEYDELIAIKVKLDLITETVKGDAASYIKDEMICVICGVKKEKGEENGKAEKADS